MKPFVLLCGPVHRPLRIQTIEKAGAEVVSLLPDSLPPAEGSHSISIPLDWLPAGDEKDLHQKTWHKADTLPLAAIASLGLAADHYWIIESDCCAPVERWKALFKDWENDPTDGVFFRPCSRTQTAWAPWWKDAPEWAQTTHLNAIYRLSSAAIAACTESAVEMREVFCEMTVANVLQRAGLTIASMNVRQGHCNCQTMKPKPEAVLLNRKLINHPIKDDSFGMDGVKSRWDK